METETGTARKHVREHATKIRCRRPITLPVYGSITVDTEVRGTPMRLRFDPMETAQIRDGLSGEDTIRYRATECIKHALLSDDDRARESGLARAHGMVIAIRLHRDFGYDKMDGHKEDMELWNELHAKAEEEVSRMRMTPPSLDTR